MVSGYSNCRQGSEKVTAQVEFLPGLRQTKGSVSETGLRIFESCDHFPARSLLHYQAFAPHLASRLAWV